MSPHIDDIELWASGFVIKYPGNEYYHVCFSLCQQAIPKPFQIDDAWREWTEAQEAMGVKEKWLHDIPDRLFPTHRQRILDILYKLNKDIRPDLVICPTRYDYHQDHQTVSNEVARAFPNSSILQYMPLKTINATNYNFFIPLNNEELEKKKAIMSIFKSQLSIKPYDEHVLATMRYFALAIGKEYVEPYVVFRYIGE